MRPLDPCTCGGLIPSSASSCPHCGASRRSAVTTVAKTLLGVAAGGSVAITLMACYGPPPRAMEDARPPKTPTSADAPRPAAPDAGPTAPPSTSGAH